jgi:hypothetical protein
MQEPTEDGNKLPKHVVAQGWMCHYMELIRCICWFFYEYILENAQSDYQDHIVLLDIQSNEMKQSPW